MTEFHPEEIHGGVMYKGVPGDERAVSQQRAVDLDPQSSPAARGALHVQCAPVSQVQWTAESRGSTGGGIRS